MRLSIRYEPDFPAQHKKVVEREIKAAVRGLLYSDLRLDVKYASADLTEPRNPEADVVAAIYPLTRYARGALYLTSTYFASTPGERHEVLRHEMAHMVSDPLVQVANSLRDKLAAMGIDVDVINAWIDEASETVTENIVRIVERIGEA